MCTVSLSVIIKSDEFSSFEFLQLRNMYRFKFGSWPIRNAKLSYAVVIRIHFFSFMNKNADTITHRTANCVQVIFLRLLTQYRTWRYRQYKKVFICGRYSIVLVFCPLQAHFNIYLACLPSAIYAFTWYWIWLIFIQTVYSVDRHT